MKKKIFRSLLLLSVASVLATAFLLCQVYYLAIGGAARAELREQAAELRDLDRASLLNARLADTRLTLIGADGTVIYDNVAAASMLANHGDRPEVEAALAAGTGESRRFSFTQGEETYYYAVRLPDGAVMRLAKTSGRLAAVFMGTLPAAAAAALGVVALSYLWAGRLTRRVIAPLDSAASDGGAEAVYDEIAPFVRTITRQREHIAEQLAELRARTETMDAIMGNIEEGLILLNKTGGIVLASRSALTLFGAAGDMRERDFLELARDLPLLTLVRAALGGEGGETELRRGEAIWRVYCRPVAGGGAMLLLLDITAQAGTEKLRREFTANVSHELRTPLTNISGYAEMLASGVVSGEDTAVFAGRIHAEAARLITLTEDILLLSSLDENGKTGLPAAEVADMGRIAAEVAEALAPGAAAAGVTLRTEGGGAVSGKRSLLYEMVYNLVDNGIKYNRPGGEVAVRVKTGAGQVEIEVRDTGAGIPPDRQERIFERFYRGEPSRSPKTGGAGLGLSIVKHVAAAHGGSVSVQSVPDSGTAVTVILPAAAAGVQNFEPQLV
ncbi:MAG: PAS domain-containing sensor histidine kinase [Gracilibacteraceae bacterium]|nr:PAS domain-containing sensor histidine kinase [Gracilibacteraceae bacterium]